ncbi:hypothetical protein CR513_35658, partial [Mucuna pruriens]
MAIIVEDGTIESKPLELVQLCCVCPHLAETSQISLYRDHIGLVLAESDSDRKRKRTNAHPRQIPRRVASAHQSIHTMVCRHLQLCGNISVSARGISAT